VWPGSPQTALIFVGLPLLTALVLLATPLHDSAPPAPGDEVAAPLVGQPPTSEVRVAEQAGAPATLPRVVARRQPTVEARVPAVIYETRRTVHRPRAARANPTTATPITAAATARAESRVTPASLGTQSP
jgi:hypothetical protein